MPLSLNNSKLSKPSKTGFSLKRKASNTFQKIFNRASRTTVREETERVAPNSNAIDAEVSRNNRPVQNLPPLVEVETILDARDYDFKTNSQIELSGSGTGSTLPRKIGKRALFKIVESDKENESLQSSPEDTVGNSSLDLVEENVKLHLTTENTDLDKLAAEAAQIDEEDPKEE